MAMGTVPLLISVAKYNKYALPRYLGYLVLMLRGVILHMRTRTCTIARVAYILFSRAASFSRDPPRRPACIALSRDDDSAHLIR
eukprot:COSAG05_NODE_309_length_11646_cov_7.176929_2_plen_84_part_00